VIGRPQPVSIGELRAVLAHVRALDAPRQARRTTGQLVAVAAFVAILAGSLRAATTHAYLPSTRHQTIEESRMRTLQSLGVVSSIAIASAATAQNAVQWRVEDGVNGHWYRFVAQIQSWSVANGSAVSLGAHLVTFHSVAESQFVRQLGPGSVYIGLQQNPSSPAFAEPAGGWEWVTGEPITYSNWRVNTNGQGNEPNNIEGGPNDVAHVDGGPSDLTWNDVPRNGATYFNYAAVFEWSADCNNDGVVDYGQIRSGELVDTNANNIPDCCEGPLGCNACRPDIDQSGAVNGVDLAAILNNWGTPGGKQPRSDVNADGIVDGADLAEVLNGWGSCP
jgi:hypothetical protein